ncbi:MAG: transposase, partial [Calditrichia bacterium]
PYNLQTSMFYNLQEFILNSPLYRKYYLLFKALDLSGIKDINIGIGCRGHSRKAILRALILKHLEEIKSVPRLIEYLENHPVIAELCGFNMNKRLPDESRFYRFLKKINNSLLQHIHHCINKKLIQEDFISLDTFIIDSKPVLAATKENNLKNSNRNTTNKHKRPKRNPSATLGYYSYQKINSQKKNILLFWGYRTHVIISKEGIPLVELTLPNNHSDAKVAQKLIRKLKRVYGLKKGAIFIADKAYDQRELYDFIIDKLKCEAVIPLNPRNTQGDRKFSDKGIPICDAELEMAYNGKFSEGKRTRKKFRCPLKILPEYARKFPTGCPIKHPRFFEGKQYGCTRYVDVTNDARANVPRESQQFKKTFKLRTEVERYFSRLGDREVEQTTHYKMKVIKNQMTIAHLSLSLVAYAAAILLKKPDKIRCFRTFAHFPLPVQRAA